MAPKHNCSVKKGKKEIKMTIIMGEKGQDSKKQKANSTGRSYSAPKPVWELLLVRQLQIILGEKLFGPQARLRITPIAWFEPATSMTSPALVARPRLPVDHLESPNYNSINSRCGEFLNTGLGGGGWGTLSDWGCIGVFPVKNKAGKWVIQRTDR